LSPELSAAAALAGISLGYIIGIREIARLKGLANPSWLFIFGHLLGACRPALREFFFAVALTFAIGAGAVAVLTLQLTLAAARTFTLGVGTLTGVTVKPQPAKACPNSSGC
jgi:hypothetical protein